MLDLAGRLVMMGIMLQVSATLLNRAGCPALVWLYLVMLSVCCSLMGTVLAIVS